MPNNKEKLEEVVSKLRRNRDDLLQEISGFSPADAMRGTEWSVLDAVRHLAPPTGGYHRYVTRMVEEENAVFPAYPPAEEIWARETEAARKVINDTIEFVEGLSEEQLDKTALRRGQQVNVTEMLDGMARHIAEHTSQIREQIRPRLGL